MNQTSKKKFPILKRHFGSSTQSTQYYLRPEAIYSLNRVLYEFLDTLRIKPPKKEEGNAGSKGTPAWIVPNLFDQYTRSWHFACVLPHVWEGSHGVECEVIQEVLWLLTKIVCRENLRAQFLAAEGNLLAGEDYAEAYRRVAAYVDTLGSCKDECLQKCPALGAAEWEGPFGITTEQEGYKAFKKDCAQIVIAALKIEDAPNRTLLVRDFLLIYHGYRTHRSLYLQGVLYRYLRENQDVVLDRFEGEAAGDFTQVVGSFISFGDECHTEKETYNQFNFELGEKKKFDEMHWGGCGIDLGFALMLPFYLREALQHKASEILVLPIHDVWLGNVGYGGLWGCLLCTFPEGGREKFVGDLLPQLKPVCEVLSSELTMSALATIASHEIVPPYDLVEHFIRMIIHVQDWEHISVYRHKQLLYCYVRILDKEEKFTWERREPSQSECCCDSPEKSEHETLTWAELDIWSRDLMPELSDEDESAFRDIVLEFEFPKTATVPRDRGNGDSTHELFEFAVIQRQIEVLRALIPKVRARRAALRSAVSAIMGRNMSHNIGSHVLARYASVIATEEKHTDINTPDHRSDFLAYLQRRMDFLAEVATSDEAFWSQPLSLGEQLSRLNYDAQCKRFFGVNATCDGKQNRPILLSYITGKESLYASVEYGKPKQDGGYEVNTGVDDSWFSCPGGEVGVHALFVILENIIRNSARHGANTKSDRVRIFVQVDEAGSSDELIKLVIVDPRTPLGEDGQPLGEDGQPTGSTLNGNELKIEKNQIAAGIYSAYDENGKRKKRLCLHNEINSILKGESFLDANGSPNPQFWGLREMQICAHYLRGMRLSDLEQGEDKGEKKLPLKADMHKFPDGKCCLKYELYLQRAKLMTVVMQDSEGHESNPRKGIQVISATTPVNWKEIADKARGYSFLVLEQEMGIPTNPAVRASLPVRTLNESDIKGLVTQAVSGDGHPLLWMERLHRSIGETSRGLRTSWKGSFCGVAVSANQALPLPGVDDTVETLCSNGKAIVVVARNTDGGIAPLPNESAWVEWHTSLDNEFIAAAWVDHPVKDDFNLSKAAFKQAGFPSVTKKVAYPVRRWVSMEGAYASSAHSNFMMQEGAKYLGWELLAAALPRVAVLDERVQSEWNTEVRLIKLNIVWPCMGVWVPEKENGTCNLDVPSMVMCREFLTNPSKCSDQFPIDFLVIHLTVLERLHKDEGSGTMSETLLKLIRETQAAEAKIIVVTGRGVPTVARERGTDHLPDVRYLPISALLETLVARPSKLALMRVLWSAGRPGQQSHYQSMRNR